MSPDRPFSPFMVMPGKPGGPLRPGSPEDRAYNVRLEPQSRLDFVPRKRRSRRPTFVAREAGLAGQPWRAEEPHIALLALEAGQAVQALDALVTGQAWGAGPAGLALVALHVHDGAGRAAVTLVATDAGEAELTGWT